MQHEDLKHNNIRITYHPSRGIILNFLLLDQSSFRSILCAHSAPEGGLGLILQQQRAFCIFLLSMFAICWLCLCLPTLPLSYVLFSFQQTTDHCGLGIMII